MSDAWGLLTTYSTAPAGSDAWTHLLAQEGGGSGSGEVIYIGPTLDADMSQEVLAADLTTALSANLIVDEVTASVDTALSASTESTTLEATVCQQ